MREGRGYRDEQRTVGDRSTVSTSPWPDQPDRPDRPDRPDHPDHPDRPDDPPRAPGLIPPPRPAGDAGTPPVIAAPGPQVAAPQGRADETPLPEPPGRPGIARHALGVLLGLVLTPVGLLLAGIGTARLADAAASSDPVDALGLSLLVVGALVLVAVVLLGLWSPAVPVAGGALWGVALGTAYLAVPHLLDDGLTAASGDRVLPAAVEQLTEVAETGQLLVTGLLLVAAGIATGGARRAGRRYAEAVVTAREARRAL